MDGLAKRNITEDEARKLTSFYGELVNYIECGVRVTKETNYSKTWYGATKTEVVEKVECIPKRYEAFLCNVGFGWDTPIYILDTKVGYDSLEQVIKMLSVSKELYLSPDQSEVVNTVLSKEEI